MTTLNINVGAPASGAMPRVHSPSRGDRMKHALAVVFIGVLGIASLVGCSDKKATMKEMVRAQLTDPQSAEFGRYEQVNSKKRDWACLEVNSKGEGGGYLGAKASRFVSPAAQDKWEFQGIAGQYDDCVRMIHNMQPDEGGPR